MGTFNVDFTRSRKSGRVVGVTGKRASSLSGIVDCENTLEPHLNGVFCERIVARHPEEIYFLRIGFHFANQFGLAVRIAHGHRTLGFNCGR